MTAAAIDGHYELVHVQLGAAEESGSADRLLVPPDGRTGLHPACGLQPLRSMRASKESGWGIYVVDQLNPALHADLITARCG